MNDTHNIGISLALDDEVSAGIAEIHGDLESLNAAIGESLAELAELRRAARQALHSYAVAGAVIDKAKGAEKTAIVAEDRASWSQSAPRPAIVSVAEPTFVAPHDVPLPPVSPSAPSPPEPAAPSEAPRTPRIEVLPFASQSLPPAYSESAPRAPISPSPYFPAEEVPRLSMPDALPLGDLLATTRAMMPNTPHVMASPMRENAPSQTAQFFISPALAAAAPEEIAPYPLATTPSTIPPSASGPGAAAPRSPLFDAMPSAAPRGASAATERMISIHGDVFFDGVRVGHWIGEQMATSAARPPAGYSGVDPRVGALWPGAPVVP